MQVRLAGDDGAGCAETFPQPRIARSDAEQVAIEMHAGTGGRTSQVEAVLYRNGQPPQLASAIAEETAGATRHRLRAGGFGTGPCSVLPQVSIVSRIPVG